MRPLALINESIFRDALPKVVDPGGQVGVVVRFEISVANKSDFPPSIVVQIDTYVLM